MSHDAEAQKQPPIADDDYNDDDGLELEALKDSDLILLDTNTLDPSVSLAHDDPKLRSRFMSPYLWSLPMKLLVLSGPFTASMLAAYSAGAYALASQSLRSEWGITELQFNAGITIFVAGFGFAPMVLAPVSEAYGRYWVYCGSGVVLFLGILGCSLSQNLESMLVSRFVAGNGAAVYATLTGGVVGDIFRKEDRNTPMALYSLSIMIGTGLGPLVSGSVVDSIGWRWIFYLQLVLVGFTTLYLTLFFRETRSNVLLQQYCRALNDNRITNRSGRTVEFNATEAVEFNIMVIWRAFAMPLRLLITEPVIFWFSMWVSFAWAVLYMQFTSVGIVFRSVYNFNSAQVGAVYTAVIVGSVICSVIVSLQDVAVRAILPRRGSAAPTPEDRLLPSCFLSILLPVGLFWFGWSARPSVHWIAPALAVGCLTIGIFSIYVAVFNYLADSYQSYASSAMAAQSMCRNLFAGIFPLVTGMMIQTLTIGGTGSLLGGLGLLLTVIPWLLYFWGKGIRARSRFANRVQGESE